MKKNFLTSIAVTLVIFGFTGCSKKDSPTPQRIYTFPTELIGTWKETTMDGYKIATNKTKILDIHSQERFSLMQVASYDSKPYWQTATGVAGYDKDTLTFTGSVNNPFSQSHFVYKYELISVSSSDIKMKLIMRMENGKMNQDGVGSVFGFKKASILTDSKIGGMWKEQQHNNIKEEKFGYYFNLNNRYEYYYYNGVFSEIKDDNDGSYWFYDNFLVLQYFNHPIDNDAIYYVECWDVSFGDTGNDGEKLMFLEASNDGTIDRYTFNQLKFP